MLTTFFVMGFGYFVADTALERPLPALGWAWFGYGLGVLGTLMAIVTVLSQAAPRSSTPSIHR